MVGAKDKRVLGAGNPKDLNISQLLEEAAVLKSGSDNVNTAALSSNLFSDDDF